MTFTQDTPIETFRPTHYLTVPVTQGVDGPARPPVTFPAGTPLAVHSQWGDLAYGDTADGRMIVVRLSEEVAALDYGEPDTNWLAMPPGRWSR